MLSPVFVVFSFSIKGINMEKLNFWFKDVSSLQQNIFIVQIDNYSNVINCFLITIENKCLIFMLSIRWFIAIFFLNIFSAGKIEKTDENPKRRGRYVGKGIKIEFTMVSRLFMALFSLFNEILGHLWNIKPIHKVKLIDCLLIFQSQENFCSFMAFISHVPPKTI